MTLTPPTTGIVYVIVGFVTNRNVSLDYRTPPTADFVVGCLNAFAFEMLVLLPLACIFAKWSRSRTILILVGCGIWFALSLAFFGTFDADSDAAIMTSLQMLIPGVALNTMFTFLFAKPAHA